jgi:hypothetical protein
LVGLFENPGDVVGSAINDRDRNDAGDLVWVFPLRAVNDLWKKAASRAQGDPGFWPVVDLALPPIDGSDRRNVVARGTESLDN